MRKPFIQQHGFKMMPTGLLVPVLAMVFAITAIKLPTSFAQTTSTESVVEQPVDDTTSEKNEKTELNPLAAELDTLIVGGWGKISAAGASQVTDVGLVSAIAACRRSRQIKSADFLLDAEKTLPEPAQTRGNVVFYKTDKGLQRLDTALRKVVLISKIETRENRKKRKIWRLSTTKGSVAVAFAKMRRSGRIFPIMIEQNSIFLRCAEKPKT